MNTWELEWLATTAAKCSSIIEVGSWCGRSTRALALHTKGTLWAVDQWAEMIDPEAGMTARSEDAEAAFTEFIRHMSEFIGDGRLNVLRAPSLLAATIIRETFGSKCFDFIFLDGDHSYNAVSSEIKAFSPLLVPGGVLAGHDNWMIGVRRAIDELAPGYQCPAGSIWVKQC